MNALLKVEWLAALRSGEYGQCRGALSKETDHAPTYCGLGVLCETVRKKFSNRVAWSVSALFAPVRTLFVGLDGELQHSSGKVPPAILLRAGLTDGEHEELLKMNDCGINFLHTADWIEANIQSD